MAKFNHIDVRGTKKVPSAFGNVFICSGSVTDAKTVVFPDGYLNGATPEPNLAFKAVFPIGHNAANASSYLSLNEIVIVSNQNGTLAPIPIHSMTEGGSTVFKVLQPNTVLELYYTADYDGNSTPAFVIIGNPVVLSSADYTIYANGQKTDCTPVGAISSFIGTIAPNGWLMCDNTVYNKADYLNLWNVLPSCFKNTTNDTFTINLRGEFLRGAGENSHTNQGWGALVGEHQNATEHIGFATYLNNASDAHTNMWAISGGLFPNNTDKNISKVVSPYDIHATPSSTGVAGQALYASRPTNTSVNYIIKY